MSGMKLFLLTLKGAGAKLTIAEVPVNDQYLSFKINIEMIFLFLLIQKLLKKVPKKFYFYYEQRMKLLYYIN